MGLMAGKIIKGSGVAAGALVLTTLIRFQPGGLRESSRRLNPFYG